MYTIKKDDKWYKLEKDAKTLVTPMGQPVMTQFKTLANKLLSDLKKYGEDPSDPVSLVAFHYAMIDFFLDTPRTALVQSVAIGLTKQNDWTFNCPTAAPEMLMEWMGLFGTGSSNATPGKKWVSSLSLMKLCAVTVLGRALESVNIPFIIATKLSPKDLPAYAKAINKYYPYVSSQEMTKYFKNFIFYFTLDSNTENNEVKSRPKKSSNKR